MRKGNILSYILGFGLAILSLLPPLSYAINILVDPKIWLYVVIIFGFIGLFIAYSSSVRLPLKLFIVYLWLSCFFSADPFISFSAYMFIVLSAVLFLTLIKSDFKVIIRFIECLFWFQIIIVVMQQTGNDVLISFGSKYKFINDGAFLTFGTFHNVKDTLFLGTIRQQMRLASLFAVMAPFLVYKNKLYIIPIALMAYLSSSSGFGLALILGVGVYVFLITSYKKTTLFLFTILFCSYCVYDYGSFYSAWVDGRFRIWLVIVKTWLMDTSGAMGSPDFLGISQTGPWDLKSILFGRGLDTFLVLFPIYKHDPNPFAQAHNCWLQLAWETGIIGFGLFSAYVALLAKRLYDVKEYILIGGLACLSMNAFVAFPTRMIQTMFLVVTFFALCEQKINEHSY